MIKLKVSYSTAAELAAIVQITAPYALPGGRTAEKQGKYHRVYITLDPARIAALTPLNGDQSRGQISPEALEEQG